MDVASNLKRSVRAALVVVLGGFLSTQTPTAQAPADPGTDARRAVVQMDREAFQQHLKAAGHRARGGIDRGKSDSTDERIRSLPHFSSSFSVQGVTYPYTMVGYPPASGRTARLRSVIVPLCRRSSAGHSRTPT
jgi:hypothetical protein